MHSEIIFSFYKLAHFKITKIHINPIVSSQPFLYKSLIATELLYVREQYYYSSN